MDISKLRKELNITFKNMNNIKNSFMVRKPMLNGGVYKTKTMCGNPNCKCIREGKLHIVWRYYYTEDGRNKVKTLKAYEILKYTELTERYKKYRKARMKLVKINKRIIEVLNLIEEELIKRGNDKK
jgi:hypothetical protein